MKMTKKLAKDLREFITNVKRTSNIEDKQLKNQYGEIPYIVYSIEYDIDFKIFFSIEENIESMLRVDEPTIVAYCPVDKGLYLLYEALEFGDIDLETYIDKTTHYIQNTMLSRPDERELTVKRRREIRAEKEKIEKESKPEVKKDKPKNTKAKVSKEKPKGTKATPKKTKAKPTQAKDKEVAKPVKTKNKVDETGMTDKPAPKKRRRRRANTKPTAKV